MNEQRSGESILLPPSTALSEARGYCGLLLIAGLHVVFSCATLGNREAFDEKNYRNNSSAGCLVSLPLQAAVTVVSLLCCFGLAKLEVLMRVDSRDL